LGFLVKIGFNTCGTPIKCNCFKFSELEAKIEDELEKMRAKLGGRYAKYAKVSNSNELPKSTLLKPENNKSPKANPKQERNASLDEGNIKSFIE